MEEDLAKEATDQLIRSRTVSACLESSLHDYQKDLNQINDILNKIDQTKFLSDNPLEPPICKSDVYHEGKIAVYSWDKAIDHAIRSVVSIQVNEMRTFDTGRQGLFNASGFVIDKDLGLILTNRHVCSTGPVSIKASFANYEEVELKCRYIDPIHDFAILKYDTNSVKYFQVEELKLNPDGAKVGAEIRVIGNDAGEKLSIQQGFIARVDREAPQYGGYSYSDFNTFYIQAATGTSFGSSGSPVITVDGCAVALNAGAAKNSQHSFYLPLAAVKRVLNKIKNKESIRRRAPLVEFGFASFAQAHCFGLGVDHESYFRRNYMSGVIYCKNVHVNITNDQLLDGDIMVCVSSVFASSFDQIENAFDDSDNDHVEVQVIRSGQLRTLNCKLEDLFQSCLAQSFLEIGDAVIHDLTYSLSRPFKCSQNGCLISGQGDIFPGNHVEKNIIKSINGVAVSNLDELVKQMNVIQYSSVIFQVCTMDQPTQVKTLPARIDTDIHQAVYYKRDDKFNWQKTQITLNALNQEKQSVVVLDKFASGTIQDFQLKKVANSIVFINSYMPLLVDNCFKSNYQGIGFIASIDHSLVVTNTDVVPSLSCKVFIQFQSSDQIEAHVIFIHPTLEYVILKFESRIQTQNLVELAPLKKSPPKLPSSYRLMILHNDGQMSSKSAEVVRISESKSQMQLGFSDVVYIQTQLQDQKGSILVDRDGKICGIVQDSDVGSFVLPSFYYSDALSIVQKCLMGRMHEEASLKLFPADLDIISLSDAVKLGLTPNWKKQVAEVSIERHSLIRVLKPFMMNNNAVQAGDIILLVDNYYVTRPFDLHLIEQEATRLQKDEIELVVLRNGSEMRFRINLYNLKILDAQSLNRRQSRLSLNYNLPYLVSFAGCNIQQPPFDVIQSTSQLVIEKYGLEVLKQLPYISSVMVGSPAHVGGLLGGFYVTSIGDQSFIMKSQQVDSVYSIPNFVKILKQLKEDIINNDPYAKLKIVVFNKSGHIKHAMIELNEVFWPTYMIAPNEQNKLQRQDL